MAVKLSLIEGVATNSVYLIRSYGTQIVQEGALWPSVMITLGPAWHKVTIMLMLVALLNVGSQKMYIDINVTDCMVQLKLYWLS